MINDIINETRQKMKDAVTAYEEHLHGIRGNRASTALVERLMVDYYGQDTELRQLANISTPEAMQILIRPYDGGAVSAIEKAIQASDIGINPSVDGNAIRLNMPSLTRERRQDLVKAVTKRAEEARISVRNARRSANNDLKEFEGEGMISEDEQKRGENEVQKLTDDYIAKVDEMTKEKEKDILEV